MGIVFASVGNALSFSTPTSGQAILLPHPVEKAKTHYANYFYINVMPEESSNATFYEHHSFCLMPDGVAMQICNKDF